MGIAVMRHRVGFVAAVILLWSLCSLRGAEPEEASPFETPGASRPDIEEPIRQLAELPDDPEKAVPILLGLLEQERTGVQMAVALRLRALGCRAIPILVRQLKDGEEGQLAVLEGFYWLGPCAKDAVPELVAFLKEWMASQRSGRHSRITRAIRALGAIGPDAEEAVSSILVALKEEGESVRVTAARSLGEIGADSEEVVSALCEAYSSLEWDRETVVDAIGKLRSRSKVSVALLVRALEDDGCLVRREAAKALGGLGPDCLEAIDPLCAALRDPERRVRDAAAGALCQYGEAEVAAPALVALLSCEDDDIQATAWMELLSMGVSAVEALKAAMDDPDASVRGTAAELIYYIGPQAIGAVPALQRLLEDPAEKVRVSAAIGLAEIGEEARPATDMLVDALADPNPEVRRYAAIALAAIGGDSQLVVNGLIRALESDNARVLTAVALALAELEVANERALPRLIELLSAGANSTTKRTSHFVHVPDRVPEAALLAIRNYGTEAKAARSKVLSLAVGQVDESTQLAALRTLAEIGVTESDAQTLASSSIADQEKLDALIFHALTRHPGIALRYLKEHPGVSSRLDEDTAAWLTGRTETEYSELKRAVFEREDLPLEVMLQTRDPRYIPVIKGRIEDAPSHRRAYLAACARVLGDPPDRIIRISEGQPGDFYADYSGRLGSIEAGHGDGVVGVMITGRIRMPDDSPAAAPKFFRTNDSMLLGEKRKDPVEFDYDAETGRFVFRCCVFAAYSLAKEREPGPYMTGTAQILIEAQGAKPLLMHFVDQMPDVEITLSWQ
jgi:HEAT repeat protein